MEDIFDDCGEDFVSIELEGNEGVFTSIDVDPINPNDLGTLNISIQAFLSNHPYHKHDICELFGGTGNVVS